MMYKKILFVVALIAACSGLAMAGTWTNTIGDGDWCNAGNWTAIPSATEPAVIAGGVGDIIIDCAAEAQSVSWTVSADNSFTIQPGASLTVADTFGYSDGDFTATIHIFGDLILDADGSTDGNQTFRAPDGGHAVVNIYPGASVWCSGSFRGADDQGSSYNVVMSGGDVNTNWFKLGDEGSGDFIMTGGTWVCRRPGGESFTIRGRGGAEFEVLIDGGAEIYVEGSFMTPQESEAIANVNIDDGTISCDEWTAQGLLWTVDINEGHLRIRNSDGTTKTAVEGWIAGGQITGFNGTREPQITWDGPDLVVTVDFIHTTAFAPDPPDQGQNVCPGDTISWGVGEGAVTHSIYFGTSLDDVNESAAPLVTGHGPNTWSPPALDLDTTYYWRVDEVNNAHPDSPWTGGVWQFTTSDGNAFAVSPENGETGVLLDSNLEWGACTADSFDVYFSTDFNDVNDRAPAASLGNTAGTTMDPVTGDLEYATLYYWAVDKIEGAVTSPSAVVWSFRTKYNIVDPNMVVLYKLDETSGDDVEDSSGYENHGNMDGDQDWRPDDGRFGGSHAFDDSAKIEVTPLATASINSQMSVSCWLKNADRPGSDNWVFGFGQGDHQFRAAVVLEGTTEVEFRAGNDSNDVLLWNMAYNDLNPSTLEDWHHWVFVKDEDAGTMRMYFDGEVVESNDVVDSTLTNIRVRPAAVGAVPYHGNDLSGQVDDFRVYNKALSDNEVAGLFRGGEVALAWAPEPRSGAVDVERDVTLSWRPGDFAAEHDVYLGNTFDDVNDATTATAGVYKGRQSDTNYVLPSALPLGSERYWRIDEVNTADVNSPWKGKVWKFTVANFITIDDMESYDPFINRIWHKWDNPWGSGSFVELGTVPFAPSHQGAQSMEYLYDNTLKWDFFSYWSETEYNFDSSQDWTDAGVKLMTLFLYGDPGNDVNSTEQFSVGVAGTSRADVDYPDMNDLLVAEWQEWNIELSAFSAAGLTAIDTVYLKFGDSSNTDTPGGDGIVYFDDIRLYPPKCVPEFGPAADISGNCIVDLADVGIMGDDWLKRDAQLAVSVPSATPVASWQFEEGTGTTVSDSGVNALHGTAEGSYEWVEGKVGLSAIDFSGGKVIVPDSPLLRPTSAVTVMAWVMSDQEQDAARIVVKGPDNRESYELEADGSDNLDMVVRADGNTSSLERYAVSTDNMVEDEWVHVAGSYDGNDLNLYLNGQLAASDSVGTFTLSQDTNDLAFGNRSDANNRAFEGKIDDVRVYDVALADAEIAHIATDGTGYVPLLSSADLYDGEPAGQKAVNFRDYAVLMQSWLEEQLWPE